MEHQLVHLLLSDNKLPLFIRTIGHLRKLNTYTDTQLQSLFIKQRSQFLHSLLMPLSSLAAFDSLKLYIELCREHVFDIITQFNSIFSSDKHSSLILSSFTHHIIQHTINTFTKTLDDITEYASLSTLYTQTMYLGLSLSRVGADIRFGMSHVFSNRLLALFKSRLDKATRPIHTQIDKGIRFETTSKSELNELDVYGNNRIIHAPLKLGVYVMFCQLYNDISTLFNESRLVMIAGQRSDMEQCLHESLESISTRLRAQSLDTPNNAYYDVMIWYDAIFKIGVLKGFGQWFVTQ